MKPAAGLLVCALMSLAARVGAAGWPRPADVHALLDVPYVTQTPELCGGAAVAMVMRYWGARDVFAQDFAPLVSSGDGGILTSVLAAAVRDRGWQALHEPSAGDAARTELRAEIDRGRPLIALIEVGPRTYHYVVIVGMSDQDVILHDPARAPFRVLPWAEFDRAWTTTGRWALLVLPPKGFRPADAVASVIPVTDAATATKLTPCAALVQHGVALALSGDREGAEQELVAATRVCSSDAASWRELAGLRFSQARYTESEAFARTAVRLAPSDIYAWQLLATSRYLTGDLMGALHAWNRTGEPRIDAIDIHGADRTRQPVVVRAAGLEPRQVLSPEAFALALRRLQELPVASVARVSYEPLSGGQARVDIFIHERKVAPTGWGAVGILGARAALLHEVRADVAGPLGGGELASASWRWSTGRPRVALSLAQPSPSFLPGTLTIDGLWEQQSYDATSSGGGATVVREGRWKVGFHLADWSNGWLRWQTGASLDHLRAHDALDWSGFAARDYLAAEGALDVRLAGDRFALAASGGWWTPFDGGDRFSTVGLLVAWRSAADPSVPFWSAIAESSAASRLAPLALWPGAGTGRGRSAFIRAHPLVTDGVVDGPVFGRRVAHGSIEYARPVVHLTTGSVSVAGFVDAARAWRRLTGLDSSSLFVDAGVGLRVHAPGSGGAIRIDIAHGLRGGGTTLSAGWSGSWPQTGCAVKDSARTNGPVGC